MLCKFYGSDLANCVDPCRLEALGRKDRLEIGIEAVVARGPFRSNRRSVEVGESCSRLELHLDVGAVDRTVER